MRTELRWTMLVKGCLITVVLLGMTIVGGGSLAGAPSHEEAERLRSLRRSAAAPIEFHALYYSIEGERETRLFLMNPTPDTIAVEVTAVGDGGVSDLPLGSWTLESLRHADISLREVLSGFEDRFASGRLRLSVLGDADTLQGWVVIVDGDEVVELPLLVRDDLPSTAFTALWGRAPARGTGAERATFCFLNISDEVLVVNLAAVRAGAGEEAEILRLEPGELVSLDSVGRIPLGRQGALRVEHDGEPGELLAAGVLRGRRVTESIPMISLAQAKAERAYESLALDAEAGHVGGEIRLVVQNLAESPNQLMIDIVAADSGVLLGQSRLGLRSHEIRALPISALAGSSSGAPYRLRIRATVPGLIARATRSAVGEGTRELALFPALLAHPGGTYPLPAIDRYTTRTRIVNLGDESSTIGAQIYWDGGTYALGPIEVPAGGSHEIDLEQVARLAQPDVLERVLDPVRPDGVLKWTVLSGSTSLLGRTEVGLRDRGTVGAADRFGFNCWGCCWQYPSGEVVPSSVSFLPGETRSFQACVSYDTCSGTMGPYVLVPQSMTVPSPFSWNGSSVGASGPAKDFISFSDPEMRITPTCTQYQVNVQGYGQADSCGGTLAKSHNPAQRWDPGATCTSQVGGLSGQCSKCYECCSKIYSYNLCKGVNGDLANAEYQTCQGHCLTDVC